MVNSQNQDKTLKLNKNVFKGLDVSDSNEYLIDNATDQLLS